MFLSFLVINYRKSFIQLFGFLLITTLLFFQYSEAIKFEYDVCDMTDGSSGVCRVFQECPLLIDFLEKGLILKRDIVFCGFKGNFELICCPTEDDVETQATTTLPIDGPLGNNEVTIEKPVYTLEPPAITPAPIASNTNKVDFWSHLLTSTTTTTTSITAPPTTTSKPIIFDYDQIDNNSNFNSNTNQLKENSNGQETTSANEQYGQIPLGNIPQTFLDKSLVNGFVNGPQIAYTNGLTTAGEPIIFTGSGWQIQSGNNNANIFGSGQQIGPAMNFVCVLANDPRIFNVNPPGNIQRNASNGDLIVNQLYGGLPSDANEAGNANPRKPFPPPRERSSQEYENNFGLGHGNILRTMRGLKNSINTITSIIRKLDSDSEFVYPDQFRRFQGVNTVGIIGNGINSTTTTTITTLPPPSPTTKMPIVDRPIIEACRNIERNLKISLTTHILDGTPVEPGEYPHMAAIGYSSIGNDDSPYIFDCGGSLIHEKFVLTAAHCVIRRGPSPVIVRLGMTDFNDPDEIPNRVEIPIKKTHVPDDYSSLRTYNDIAVLELEREVEFSDYIYPACLYTDPDDPPDNSILYVTGWGTKNLKTREKSNVLLKAKLQIEPSDRCLEHYNQYGRNARLNRGLLKSQFCARDPESRKDSCLGDSGGPLNMIVDESTRNFRIVGVISTGYGCAGHTPGLYTRVSSYLDFIENIVWPTK